jgi:hypothetical protein
MAVVTCPNYVSDTGDYGMLAAAAFRAIVLRA